MSTKPLNVVILQREGFYIAQCLEYNIAAQGRTLEELQFNFTYCFLGKIMLNLNAGKQPMEGVSPAPQKYWDLRARTMKHKSRFTLDEPQFDFDDVLTERPQVADLMFV